MNSGYKSQSRPYTQLSVIGNGYNKDRLIYGQGVFSFIARAIKSIFKPAMKAVVKSGARTASKIGAKVAKTGIKQASKAGVRIAKDAGKKVASKITKESVKKYGKKIGKELAETATEIAISSAIDGLTGLSEGKSKDEIIEEQRANVMKKGKAKISEISAREKDLIQRRTRDLLKEEEIRAREEAKKLQKNLNDSFDSVIGGEGLVQMGVQPKRTRGRGKPKPKPKPKGRRNVRRIKK